MALTIILTVSCASKKTQLTIPEIKFDAFSGSGYLEVPEFWWTAFEDEGLNQVVERALRDNLNLETAWRRLREAQALVDLQYSSLFPDLEGIAEAETRRSESANDEILRIGLASSYEVDLWGRIRSEVEAGRYRARAAHADYQTAAMSLSAEVALTWYQLMEAWNQLQLIEKQIESNRKVLRLIENRFDLGQSRSVDVLRQRQLLESTREQKYSIESNIRVLQNRLAVLEGRPPRGIEKYSVRTLPDLPPLPDAGLPAALIRRRPDVQGAFKRLQAADKDLAAAVSNQYPRLAITGSIFTSENDGSDLFVNWAHSIAGGLVAPVFDAGRRKAQVDRTEAVKQQRFYEYGQAVIVAFQEVEDALVQERKQKQQIRSIEEQLDLARLTIERLQFEYFNGISGYIDVLLALIQEQLLRRDLLTQKRLLLEFRIALYRALAGSFETEREK
jgi:NodT family efflux transporter outer membrane factor (OMF) lipoprotein